MNDEPVGGCHVSGLTSLSRMPSDPQRLLSLINIILLQKVSAARGSRVNWQTQAYKSI